MQPRAIVQTSCFTKPGDSGSALVNEEGHVVGITFREPRDPTQSTLSYQVDVSELRLFWKDAAQTPQLVVPDMWALGTRLKPPHPQILLAGSDDSVRVLVDLDGDTSATPLRKADWIELVAHKTFDAAGRSAHLRFRPRIVP